jgi:hypothetical protein
MVVSYPYYPTARPRNMFGLLPPPQHVLDKARKAGVNTRLRPEVEAWRRAGRPATWINGRLDR